MSNVYSIAAAGVQCALVPLREGALLTPNTLIAEVVEYRAPEPVHRAPAWYLGRLRWRGLPLPVISLERLMGGAPDLATDARTRLVVLYGLGERRRALPYYGVVARGLPRLQRVVAANIEIDEAAPDHDAIAVRVRVGGEAAMVPDVDLLCATVSAVV